MTASTKSNLPSDLLTQLETLRPQMNHISSDIHWVQLDPHIRGILRNALQIAEHDEISEVLSLPERLIPRFSWITDTHVWTSLFSGGYKPKEVT